MEDITKTQEGPESINYGEPYSWQSHAILAGEEGFESSGCELCRGWAVDEPTRCTACDHVGDVVASKVLFDRFGGGRLPLCAACAAGEAALVREVEIRSELGALRGEDMNQLNAWVDANS